MAYINGNKILFSSHIHEGGSGEGFRIIETDEILGVDGGTITYPADTTEVIPNAGDFLIGSNNDGNNIMVKVHSYDETDRVAYYGDLLLDKSTPTGNDEGQVPVREEDGFIYTPTPASMAELYAKHMEHAASYAYVLIAEQALRDLIRSRDTEVKEYPQGTSANDFENKTIVVFMDSSKYNDLPSIVSPIPAFVLTLEVSDVLAVYKIQFLCNFLNGKIYSRLLVRPTGYAWMTQGWKLLTSEDASKAYTDQKIAEVKAMILEGN